MVFSACVNTAPELRVSDIPAEAMAIISDCQIPLMLIGITWPHDLAKSPLLYANTAMLNLIGGNTETDHPARAFAWLAVPDRRPRIRLFGRSGVISGPAGTRSDC